MTTVVNNPAPAATTESGGSGFLIGAIVLIGFVAILMYLGFMAMGRMRSAQVNVPAPQIVLPDKIDVNVTPAK